MTDASSGNLGIYITSKALYYAVSAKESESTGFLYKIGAFDFNFQMSTVFNDRLPDSVENLSRVIQNICSKYAIDSIRCLVQPGHECWSSLPKMVKDKEDERETHIKILSSGKDRSQLQLYWFDISKPRFKFLVIRDRYVMNTYQNITEAGTETDFVSEFEMGSLWSKHASIKGSFLTVSCTNSVLSIASFVLGKLRAATYIPFSNIWDLPYLWKLYSNHLPWLTGFHEQIYLYGEASEIVLNNIKPYLDQSAEIITMDSLKKCGIRSEEQTFGFDLELAFPAMLLSLDI